MNPPRHHLVCRHCGRTEQVPAAVRPCPPLLAGFTVDAAEIVFRGRCPDCVSAGSTMVRPADIGR